MQIQAYANVCSALPVRIAGRQVAMPSASSMGLASILPAHAVQGIKALYVRCPTAFRPDVEIWECVTLFKGSVCARH